MPPGPAGRSTALRARVATAPRFFDPAGEIARLHMGGDDESERIAEVDALAAALPHEGDACERLLAQLGRITGFPLLFVSVVRGERVGYRVQRGLDVRYGEMRDRRRETTFCTHTVSCGEPLIIPNAGEEPFFRGSNMVRRFGVRAYVGVPLTTSRGVAIGTVCAMDYRPRRVDPSMVRALGLFTEPVLAEIERARRPPSDQLARTAAGAPIHAASWMRALLDAEREVARVEDRPSTLIVARGEGAEQLADAAGVDEVAGRVAPDAVALLLPGVHRDEAERRAASMGHGGLTLHVEALPPGANFP